MTLPDKTRLDLLCASLFGPNEPGAAFGVLGPGGFSYAAGFGLANLDGKIPFTAQTPFRACSISKQFVCLLVRQMENEGVIDIDRRPAHYLPALADFPAKLTIRHLCQNRSGLLDYWCAAMLTGARAESRFTLDQGAALIRSLKQPMFEAGSQYSYNNGNWRILEWIIEAVTGRTVPDLLQERVFAPLAMKSTMWGSDTSLPLPGDAKGYWHPAGWQEEITRIFWSGDAALVTTMEDMLKWEAAMLKPDTRLLPCADRLMEAMPHPDGSAGSYAFGINVWQNGGRWMQWHGGALRGWRMVHMRFPQDGVAVAVMMNRTGNPTPHALRLLEEMGVKPTWDALEGILPTRTHVNLSGVYLSASLGLIAEMAATTDGASLELGGEAVALVWTDNTTLASSNGFFRADVLDSGLRIHAHHFGWRVDFRKIPFRDDRPRLASASFFQETLQSRIKFSARGNSMVIEGPMGLSETYALRPLAENVFAFNCDRALDELPPGRFSLILSEDGQQLDVSCFLARSIKFRRLTGG
jgi:D-aminopeptidase